MKKTVLIFLSSFVTLHLIYYMYTNTVYYNMYTYNRSKNLFGTQKNEMNENFNVKYILQWTRAYTEPVTFLGKRQESFIKRRCSNKNCFITAKKRYLDDVSKFDAILFSGPEMYRQIYRFPRKRSPHQKYIFISPESSYNYPLTNKRYNNFFNWTWTYKLSSDLYFGYIIIKNKQGDIIGPKEVMHWLEITEMKTIDNTLRGKLSSKNKAAAWFVSNCKTSRGASQRYKLGKQLKVELVKHNLTLDIYGACGNKKCPKINMTDCLRKVERDYFFYLSFENSVGEDYVTEKLLHALQHYTVPIVYGGANYTRFMPNGSYLNAKSVSIDKLVQQMVELIRNKEKYYDFFRWTNHYSYHSPDEMPETDHLCRFCSKMNDVESIEKTSVYEYFRSWWNQ